MKTNLFSRVCSYPLMALLFLCVTYSCASVTYATAGDETCPPIVEKEDCSKDAKLGVLIIHGMGSQNENFACPMIMKLMKGIPDHVKICWKPVCWASVLSESERELWDQLSSKNDLHWVVLRQFIINYLGDAFAYQVVPEDPNSPYHQIHEKVHESILDLRRKLGDKDKPVIIIAHSLGSVIMFNYIWDRQNWDEEIKKGKDPYGATQFERMETLAGFVTSGSPIPLYTLAYDPVEPIDFPPDTLPDNLKKEAKWLNFFDVNDVLGWPLKTLNASYKNTVTDDLKINVGLTPLCHHGYWTNDNFTEPVAQFISDILKVCP